jgi:hypothetical protein
MKRFEELEERKVDYGKVKNLIESIFEEKIKFKSDIGKTFEIVECDYDVLVEDIEFSRKYCNDFGYELHVFLQ